jgi:Zn-finger nucleic acid-binding protein
MNLACPACRVSTGLVDLQGVEGFECQRCWGHCIRGAELERYLSERGVPRTFFELMELARDAPQSPRDLICPDCRTRTFHEVRARVLAIDVCSTCVGVYLDKGEAASLLQTRAVVLDNAVDAVDAIGSIVGIIYRLFH